MKAFPNVTGEKGMDLRDYFAAVALQGMLSIRRTHKALGRGILTEQQIAVSCYQWADDMMEARKNDTDK
jgi:hypothetical protein